MAESRCGLICTGCHWGEIMNCPGCTKITKPYWGPSCVIKNCVEKKKLEHCGDCPNFPCKQLHEFAFDPATGDEGNRIEVLTDWQTKPADGQ